MSKELQSGDSPLLKIIDEIRKEEERRVDTNLSDQNPPNPRHGNMQPSSTSNNPNFRFLPLQIRQQPYQTQHQPQPKQ